MTSTNVYNSVYYNVRRLVEDPYYETMYGSLDNPRDTAHRFLIAMLMSPVDKLTEARRDHNW